ncbi:hypothetical protein, partial [Nocardia brasiliensis]|uniref:hypothetical protein n=1 Tax=Nocardia brasiliensis TaxID=37326 RepID=UPI0024590069
PATTALQLPRGEGLSLPVGDPFWNSPDAALIDRPLDLTESLTMPFWGDGPPAGRWLPRAGAMRGAVLVPVHRVLWSPNP